MSQRRRRERPWQSSGVRKTGALLAVEIRTAVHRCNGCNRRHRKITAADFRRGQGGDGACGAGGYHRA